MSCSAPRCPIRCLAPCMPSSCTGLGYPLPGLVSIALPPLGRRPRSMQIARTFRLLPTSNGAEGRTNDRSRTYEQARPQRGKSPSCAHSARSPGAGLLAPTALIPRRDIRAVSPILPSLLCPKVSGARAEVCILVASRFDPCKPWRGNRMPAGRLSRQRPGIVTTPACDILVRVQLAGRRGSAKGAPMQSAGHLDGTRSGRAGRE
jgi:hypothetical protein